MPEKRRTQLIVVCLSPATGNAACNLPEWSHTPAKLNPCRVYHPGLSSFVPIACVYRSGMGQPESNYFWAGENASLRGEIANISAAESEPAVELGYMLNAGWTESLRSVANNAR